MSDISYYRAKEAQRIYQELQEMTEATYIADTILAYLQSPSFFMLVILVMGYRLGVMYVKGQQHKTLR